MRRLNNFGNKCETAIITVSYTHTCMETQTLVCVFVCVVCIKILKKGI